MADAVQSGICDIFGLGRAVVIEPTLPRDVLLNPKVPDEKAIARSFIVKGLWLAQISPTKIVGMCKSSFVRERSLKLTFINLSFTD